MTTFSSMPDDVNNYIHELAEKSWADELRIIYSLDDYDKSIYSGLDYNTEISLDYIWKEWVAESNRK